MSICVETQFDFNEAQKMDYMNYKSHVMDTDMAEESAEYTKTQIRRQTAGVMYLQANTQAQFALSLLS